MKKTTCSMDPEFTNMVFECGNIIVSDYKEIYLVTDMNTIVCIHSKHMERIGTRFNINNLTHEYLIFHGTITMEN